MPRGRDPSWAMKTAIWDLASKLGPKPEVILRDLQRFCRRDMPLEGEILPDPRTITNTINKLQTLSVKVLATLPPHVWEMRKDYKEIQPELERLVQAGGNIGPSVFEQAHTKGVFNLLDAYAMQLKVPYEPEDIFIGDRLVVFPPILEKEPSFAAVEGHYKHTKLGEDVIKYKQAVDAYRSTGLELERAIITKDCLVREAGVALELLMKVVRIKLAPVRLLLYMEGIETDQETIFERISEVLKLRGQSGKPLEELLEFVSRYKHNMEEEGKVILELLGRLQENYERMKRLEKAIIRDIEEEKLKGILPTGTKCKFCPPAIIKEADSTIRGGAL